MALDTFSRAERRGHRDVMRGFAYADRARSRRADLARLVKEKNDAIEAERVMTEVNADLSKRQAKRAEMYQASQEAREPFEKQQEELINKWRAGELDDEAVKKKLISVRFAMDSTMAPFDRDMLAHDNQTQLHMQDIAVDLWRKGSHNPMLVAAAKGITQSAAQIGAGISGASAGIVEKGLSMQNDMQKQAAFASREEAGREGAVELENLETKNTLSEIEARGREDRATRSTPPGQAPGEADVTPEEPAQPYAYTDSAAEILEEVNEISKHMVRLRAGGAGDDALEEFQEKREKLMEQFVAENLRAAKENAGFVDEVEVETPRRAATPFRHRGNPNYTPPEAKAGNPLPPSTQDPTGGIRERGRR